MHRTRHIDWGNLRNAGATRTKRIRQLLHRRVHGDARGPSKAAVPGRGRRKAGAPDLEPNHSRSHTRSEEALASNMKSTNSRPPMLASWLVQSVLPADHGAAMVGDLIEEYYERCESTSPASASWWFWSQACRSIPSITKMSLLRHDRLGSASIAMSVFVVMATLKVVVEQVLSASHVLTDSKQIVLAPMIFLATTSIAGCIARLIRRGATLFLALFVLVAVIVLISIRVCTIPVPWWYELTFLILGPSSVLITPALIWAIHSER